MIEYHLNYVFFEVQFMRVAGIIAEYNPFHLGHKKQIAYARETLGADYIIAAMSGAYVQRGAPALFPKHLRTKMALLGGADLVLELPVSISSASAEFFAAGGADLLDGIGVTDLLCFGSESGKINFFQTAAHVLSKEPEEYKRLLKSLLKEGNSFPSARSQALLSYLLETSPEDVPRDAAQFLASPNNILGIEYCKAIAKLNSSIRPVTLLREGAAYHDTSLTRNAAPSASGIRAFVKDYLKGAAEGKTGSSDSKFSFRGTDADELTGYLKNFLPEEILPLFIQSLSHNAFLTEDDLDLLLHYKLLSTAPEDMAGYLDLSKDLAERIANHLNEYSGFSQFVQILKTKELTYTRIQRALLHLLLGIRRSPSRQPYARVLGFRKDSTPLLKEIKKRSRLPLLTKLSNASKILDPDGMALLKENTYASNVYESLLCKKEGRPFLHEYARPLTIL